MSTVFHVTRTDNLPSILRAGLLPAIGERAALQGETTPAVYCFPSREALEDALGNWLGDELPDDDLSILELQVDGLTLGAGAEFEVVIVEPIPPCRLLAIYDEDWRLARTCSSA